MTISEPATLITDYLLAVFTSVLAYRLWQARTTGAHAAAPAADAWLRWWTAAFASTAVAGITGGTVHGFQHALDASVLDAVWLVTLELLLAAAYFVVRAVIVRARPGRSQRDAVWAAGVTAISYSGWIAYRPVFLYAIVAYGAALVLLAAASVRVRPLDRSRRLLIGGIVVSAVAAVVQQSGWSPSRHFNHNDLYHVVQAWAVWLLYRGAVSASLTVR